MLTELSNLKIGRQDPKLFEIPDGFTKLDMGGMMGGTRMGRQGQPMGRPDMSGCHRPAPENAPPRPEVTTPQATEPAPEQEPPARVRTWKRPASS